MDKVIFSLFILNAVIHLGQLFFYGLQESNRPSILFGVVYLFLAFSFEKPIEWVKWAVILVPFVGFIGALSGFSDSPKPNWLNYLIILLNLTITILCVVRLF